MARETAVTRLALTERAAALLRPRLELLRQSRAVDLQIFTYPMDAHVDVDIAFLSRELFVGSTVDHFAPALDGFFRFLERQPDLKWLHISSAGIDFETVETLLSRNVRVTTSSGTTAEPIAQSALAGILCLSRGTLRWIQHQQQGRWAPPPMDQWPRDLRGQTATIIGMGPIGREIARLLKALGLHVIGVRRNLSDRPPHCDEVRGPDELAEIARRTDWLVVACPLTEETRGLVDRRILYALPRGAGVANVARGAIVEEPALIDALSENHLSGAFLDAFTEEPLPKSSPLWGLENVIVSPHSSAISTGNEHRQAEQFAENLALFLDGATMKNGVIG